MPDRRKHRGPAPQDERLFAAEQVAALRSAVADLSWLLSRGYASPSSVKIVGDRYDLTARQRVAVSRAACSDAARAGRLARMRVAGDLAGRAVAVDGYNLLITLESALGGGVILGGRDRTYRDLASLHGHYRAIEETQPALELAGQMLAELGAAAVRWVLDSQVSNSGRLKKRMGQLAESQGWPWTVELARDADAEVAAAGLWVVTGDSVVLDRCGDWVNLARHIIDTRVPDAWVVDLSGEQPCQADSRIKRTTD